MKRKPVLICQNYVRKGCQLSHRLFDGLCSLSQFFGANSSKACQVRKRSLPAASLPIHYPPLNLRGPGSSVGIPTELRGGRSGDRIPVGSRFSVPVQTDPWTASASCTIGTGSFPEVKTGQGVTLTTHPLLAPWS